MTSTISIRLCMATRRRKGEMLKGRPPPPAPRPPPERGRGTCHVGSHTFFKPDRGQYSP